MAFSYSDKNFTVIGNLCFVHILFDGTKTIIEMPPAISDRMPDDEFVCIYPYYPVGKSVDTPQVGFAHIDYNRIRCDTRGKGYLSSYFPIDSNK